MDDPEESELVDRLKRRDEAAFRELVLRYETRIYRLVLRMIGDPSEAQDLAQDVFVTVFRSIEGFRGESRLSTWLYRVAANHCKNRLKYLSRRARGRKRSFDEAVQAHALDSASMSTSANLPAPDQVIQGRQLEMHLRMALEQLPTEQRELVILRDIEDLTYEEIQSITDLPAGTVKSRLHRARLALMQQVRHLQGERS